MAGFKSVNVFDCAGRNVDDVCGFDFTAALEARCQEMYLWWYQTPPAKDPMFEGQSETTARPATSWSPARPQKEITMPHIGKSDLHAYFGRIYLWMRTEYLHVITILLQDSAVEIEDKGQCKGDITCSD